MQEALNRIYNLECLEGMQRFLNKYGPHCIDMILCDLPYGTTQNKWDSIIPLDPLWSLYTQLIKPNGAVVLTAQTPFDKVLGASNLKMLKYEWIWKKNIATGHLNVSRMPMKDHENVLVFYNKQPTYNPQLVQGSAYTQKRKKIDDNGTNYGRMIRTDTVNEGFRHPKTENQSLYLNI